MQYGERPTSRRLSTELKVPSLSVSEKTLSSIAVLFNYAMLDCIPYLALSTLHGLPAT